MQDFDDFFDTPRERAARATTTQPARQPSPKPAGRSDDHDRASSRASSHASSNRTVDLPPKKSSNYKSDSDDDDKDASSDRNRENSDESRKTKKVIHATLPVVTKSSNHNYDNDSFESESEEENRKSVTDSARSKESTNHKGRDRNSPRSRSRSESEASRGSRSPNNRDKNSIHRKTSVSKTSSKKKSEFSDDSEVTDSDEEALSKSDATNISKQTSSHHSGLANGRNSGSRSKKHVTVSDIEGLKSGQLSALLQTVLDMERENSRARSRQSTGGVVYYKQKKNYSFSNDRVKQIERENQRLLQKIINQSDSSQKAKRQTKFSIQPTAGRPLALPSRPTSASINRNKELQRIDAENLALLKRLQGARASNSLRRDVQINDYHQQLIRSGAISSTSLAALRDCRFEGGTGSRPQSGVRPYSGKSSSSQASQASIYATSQRSRRSKPEWNDRWQSTG